MLLEKKQSLENIIVSHLSKHQGVSANQLRESLIKQGYNYSQRGIYKELKKLENQEIVSKIKQQYHLRLDWIINLLAFADNAYDSYSNSDYLKAQLLSSSSEKTRYSFNSLRKLDLCWIQLMISLHKMYPKNAMFLYCPFQWFHLLHGHATKQFFTAVELSSHKRYHIIGNDSYLDRLSVKDLPQNSEVSFSESPFHSLRQKYYSIIGDHLITVTLDKNTTLEIEELFATINSKAKYDLLKIHTVLNSKVKASIIIEEKPQKAKKLLRTFSDYFGVVTD